MYGANGPPTPGPSSQVSPSQVSESYSTWYDSGRLRPASVSSTRSTNVPPKCRANTQLNSALRTLPTCRLPVGDGGNRTRTWSGARPPSTLTGSASVQILTHPAWSSVALRTMLVRAPIPSISTVISWPGSINATPSGVPVKITSPGSNVVKEEM